MKRTVLRRMLPVTAGLLLFAGCAVERPEAEAGPAPPPPQEEVVPPQPNLMDVWTPGYWDWRGRWVWIHGYWAPRPHPGAIWVQGGWMYRHHHRVWIHPHWQ